MWFHKLFNPCLRSLLTLLAITSCVSAIEYETFFSQHGMHGTITFSAAANASDKVAVKVAVSVAEEALGEYTWGIFQFPIDYSVRDYCDNRMLGRRPVLNLNEDVGKLMFVSPDEESGGPHKINLEFEADSSLLALDGKDSVWGRSMVLQGPSNARICGNINPKVEKGSLRTAEARFTSPLAGSVWFSSLSKGSTIETKILSNLYHVQTPKSTQHVWRLFVTDILDQASDIYGGSCDFLQLQYNPHNQDGEGCSEEEPEKCKQGDMSGKFGALRAGKRESMFTKSFKTDTHLELPELDGPRSVFLVVYDQDHPDSFLGCAKLRHVKPKVAKAVIMDDGVKGKIEFFQHNQFHPVISSVSVEGLAKGAGGFHIHEYPVPPKMGEEDNPCGHTAGHFNPFRFDKSVSPPTGSSSLDKYEVGDLSGKYGSFKGRDDAAGTFTDPHLSLFGKYSIVGRSLVLHRVPVPHRWLCANIETHDVPMVTAVAIFTYPLAGKIIFRQEAGDPFADTQILVESLLYSDGSKNESSNHPWHVHVEKPGKDFFNWTGRCLSAGPHYNPYNVATDDNMYNDCVNEHIPLKCELGDLANKHEGIVVAGRKKNAKKTMRFFTDINLPLSGGSSIIGHSLVLHDNNAPEHRGNRMACTEIKRHYRHKAVARKWFGNGIQPPPVSGRLEFVQETDRSTTHTLVDLHGMKGEANSYHVHQIPVQDQLEFPCTGAAVGGHFNPYNYDASESPKPSTGTPDQYEMGDLSGKYGMLASKRDMEGIYNDTNLPLYGPNSIIGRSIVVHKKEKGARWACASIGWGFDPDEAREVRAIASFHHPNGFAWGYIRFSQVIYRDGSSSDTNMEIRLKYPGKTNKDITVDHNWSVYVNPVGHDASVKYQDARCTAAGYRWNPTHIHLAAPNDHGFYAEECGSDYPLRCQVGDLSGRHGRISVGSKAYIVNDVNLPLSGDWYHTAIGKSIVIHGPGESTLRMACANIEEDKDIVKFATIRTLPRFNLATFMEDVQGIMGIPEWYLYVDSRKTKSLYQGKCIQIQLHFTGPHANRLEQDFNRLLRTGKLESPSITSPGHVVPPDRNPKLGYRECGSLSKSPLGSANSANDLYTRYNAGVKASASWGSVVAAVLVAAYVRL